MSVSLEQPNKLNLTNGEWILAVVSCLNSTLFNNFLNFFFLNFPDTLQSTRSETRAGVKWVTLCAEGHTIDLKINLYTVPAQTSFHSLFSMATPTNEFVLNERRLGGFITKSDFACMDYPCPRRHPMTWLYKIWFSYLVYLSSQWQSLNDEIVRWLHTFWMFRIHIGVKRYFFWRAL